ncbi:MAG TPA: aminotransferase class V-fold PLP-dependent enzyme [Streptosporangiaceae bacterium]|nr:aminotransferase class V-fold PLP-dependent enzyme [Streptosporangiaceae bacterium]
MPADQPDGRPAAATVTPSSFREMFPALARQVWLDTPASAPGAIPVTAALASAVAGWQEGSLGAADWEAAAPRARAGFARYLGVPEAHVALMGSVAEAAATVAVSLPGQGGTVVVGDGEFRSNLFPWLALEARGYSVIRAPDSGSRTESLLAAIDEQTTLIAVSHVLSADGERADLVRLRAAADAVGAQVFADVTQSLGVLGMNLAASRPDYLAVHGYKWLLCPRGAAWLVTQHHDKLRPLMPGWKSAADGGYFGGSLRLAAGAARCDTSPAWLSWTGAEAAIALLSALPAAAVERHCLHLAAAFRDGALEIGAPPAGTGQPSHIAVVRVRDPDAVSVRLRATGIRAQLLGDRLRVGFHYFNNDEDVAAALDALRG